MGVKQTGETAQDRDSESTKEAIVIGRRKKSQRNE